MGWVVSLLEDGIIDSEAEAPWQIEIEERDLALGATDLQKTTGNSRAARKIELKHMKCLEECLTYSQPQ